MKEAAAAGQIDDWNAHWSDFAESARQNPAQVYRHQLIVKLLCDMTRTPNFKLLDFGSGQGDFLARAADTWPQAKIAGFELSEFGVEMTRRKVPHADVHCVDLLLPKPELESYSSWANAAVCSEVLEHLDDPAAFVTTASRYLTSGGTLIVTVPGGPMSAFDRVIGHRRHFTRETISDLLGKSGFVVERVMLAGFPFFNLYRSLVIARGARLASDINQGTSGQPTTIARLTMTLFSTLFRANLSDSPFGWQVVAIARKPLR